MSVTFEQSKNYNPPMFSSDIPSSIMSTPVIRPRYKSSVRQVVAISNSGDQSNGGLIQVQIPSTSNAFLKSSSAYFRFQLTVVRGTTGQTLGMNGGAVGSASSVINRVTVQSGGNNLESILYYSIAEQMFLLNKTNSNWLTSEASAMEGANRTDLGSVNSLNTTFEFCVPLISGLFNSQNDVPLCLLSSPLTVLFELQSNPFIAFVDSATSITSWTLSYAGICYSQLEVDQMYIQELKQALNQGQMYTIPSQTIQLQALQTQSSINYLLALSCNSLQSVHFTNVTNPSAQTSKMYFTANGLQICNIFLDGFLLNQIGDFNVSKYCAQVFAESRKSWNPIGDPNISMSILPDGSGAGYVCQNDQTCNYLTKYFSCGVSSQNYRESNLSFTGSSSQLLRFEINMNGNIPSNTTTYILAVFDVLFSISQDGSITRNI